MKHIPVLKKEVIQYLDPKPNENFIDCTIGGAGHALAILEKIQPNGLVLGIDWDGENIRALELEIQNFLPAPAMPKALQAGKFKNNLILACDNYANLEGIIKRKNFKNISGILLDLGFSSRQIEESGRGFSFLKNEPLDMRFSPDSELTAEKIINEYPPETLAKIIEEYGEERFARRIAENIVELRKRKKISSTFELADIIRKSAPRGYERGRIHPATRTFQALRIEVNGELDNLKKVLPQAVEALESGGRLAVISFHSLEDRIVKNFFRDKKTENLAEILTKKPILASDEEISTNPRARSAKLRVLKKCKYNNLAA